MHNYAILRSGWVQRAAVMVIANARILAPDGAMSIMRTLWKATLAALSITVFIGVAGCANAQPYGYGGYDSGYGDPYGDPYGYNYAPGGVPYDYASGGYCDEWGCPDDYYDMPLYYGSVYYGGSWFNGPLYYRDWGGGRQYWVHGGWHYDSWRGARPSWYREGRYGPALGRDFYRSDRFRAFDQRDRGGFNRGFDNRRDNRNDFNRGDNRGFNGGRPQVNRNDGNRNFGNRNDNGRNNAAPQDRGPRQDFQRSGGERGDRGNFQRNSAPRNDGPRDNGGGNRGGGDRGNRGR